MAITNDYKSTIQRFIGNGLNPSSTIPSDDPQFASVEENDASEIKGALDTAFPYGYYQRGTIACKDGYGKDNGITLVYGSYAPTQSATEVPNRKGYILLLDENYQILELITQFNSGTDLYQFLALEVDENGNLYGLDMIPGENNSTIVRFIMLNNPSMKTPNEEHYKVILKKSYYISSEMSGITYLAALSLYKSPNSSSYYVGSESFGVDGAIGLEIKINVGSANEYHKYYATNVNIHIYISNNYAYWDSEDKLHITMYGLDLDNSTTPYSYYLSQGVSNDNYQVVFNRKINESINEIFFPNQSVEILTNSQGSYMIGSRQTNDVMHVDNDEFYYVGAGYLDPHIMYVKWLYYKDGEYDIIHVLEHSTSTTPRSYNKLYMMNGEVYSITMTNTNTSTSYPLDQVEVHFVSNIKQSDTHYFSSKIGLCDMLHNSWLTFNILSVSNQYNLYKFYILAEDYETGWTSYETYMVFNRNSETYKQSQTFKATIPYQALIYNEDNRVVFARNLYDIIVYGNTTESVLEIPNTMLNGITLAKQQLLGKTYEPMIDNEDDIEKNIYENLYVNFFLKLQVQNRNTSTYIDYPDAANKINQSFMIDDYSTYIYHVPMRKIVINYTDGTNAEKGVSNIYQDRVEFIITVVKDIDTIDIYNSDKTILYTTITNFDNYEIGKTYTLRQYFHVE